MFFSKEKGVLSFKLVTAQLDLITPRHFLNQSRLGRLCFPAL